MTRTDGLWLFIAVVVTNIIGLVADLILWRYGLPTVTEFCRRNTWAAGLLVGWNCAGALGLWVHLLGPVSAE